MKGFVLWKGLRAEWPAEVAVDTHMFIVPLPEGQLCHLRAKAEVQVGKGEQGSVYP